MIIDRLEHAAEYESMVPGITAAYERIKELEQAGKLQDGKYELPGKDYFFVQSGETKSMDVGMFEAHRKFLDVQIILEGAEELAWEELTRLTTGTPYDEERDIEFLEGRKEHHLLVSEGMFYVVFPHDAHKPGSHTNQKYHFRKAVVKLAVR